MSSAYNLGSLYGRWRYTNAFIGNGDYNDYWRFTINSAGGIYPGFNLYMSGMSADADVTLLNSSGSTIASSTRGGSSSESIGISGLSPGTYYARVYPYSGYTYYNLELRANYGGTSLGSAPSINRQDLLDGWSIPDFVGYGYDDYYKVSVDRTSTINLSLTGMSADADLRLLNSSGSVIASSSAGGSTSDYISNFTISSGTYYVQVDPFSSAETNYSLGARVIPQDYTGNSFTSSRYVGFLSSRDITFDEFVGAYDTDD